jgi:hypothetical protein
MSDGPSQDPLARAHALTLSLPEDDPRRAALLRLEASRRRIRLHWAPLAGEDVNDFAFSADSRWGRGRFWRRCRAWARHLHIEPAVKALSQEVQRWWTRQSWAPVATLAVEEIRTAVKPSIRRHPAAWIGAGLLAGAVLIWMRPWRHPWVRKQCAPMPGQVGRWVLAQCAQPAVYMALTGGLVSLLEKLNPRAEDGSQGEQAEEGAQKVPEETSGLKG